MKPVSFNRWTMKLGKLCQAMHEFESTMKSLRYKAGTHGCVICRRQAVKKRRSNPWAKALDLAAAKRWREKSPEKHRANTRRAMRRYRAKNKNTDTIRLHDRQNHTSASVSK